MQLYTIKINEAAELDLENAGDYIAYELLNPEAAENTDFLLWCSPRRK